VRQKNEAMMAAQSIKILADLPVFYTSEKRLPGGIIG
jgi:hypothetical protein